MKKFLTLLFLMLVITAARAQSPDETAITGAIESLRQAMIAGNKEALTRLTSADLSYGHSTGLLEDQAAFIQSLSSRAMDVTQLEFSTPAIHVLDNIALVRNEFHGTVNGSVYNLGVLMVWRKENGQWVLLARQSFKL